MNIPRYWARANDGHFHGVGWSFTSQSEADASARRSLAEVIRRHRDGTLHAGTGDYYTSRPVREPIVREFTGRDGNPSAFVTRNLYGSYVLNTASALFVDVDLEDEVPPESAPQKRGGLLSRLFGTAPQLASVPEESSKPPTAEEMVRARAADWAKARPGWAWRIYRTKAGLRILATHALLSPDDAIVAEAFDALGCDPLYRKLCAAQRCFRARLSPKPWRCGFHSANLRWPWRDSETEQHFATWDRSYTEACKPWATCRILETTGSGAVHPELESIIEFHDALTRCASNAPLA